MKKERDAYFDNLKGILIILVVIGHIIEPFYFKSRLIEIIYTFIYTFHMPAFIFLSGLFFKADLKKVFYFLKLYLVFQLLKLGLNYFLFSKNITLSSLLYPTWTLWYLLSTFFWYLISYFNEKIKLSILMMFIISLLSGFIPYFNGLLSFQRTLAYLGFFSLGVFINFKNFKNTMTYFKTKRIYIYILILYCILISLLVVKKDIPIQLFYNNSSYLSINFFSKSYLNIFIRIFNFIMAFIISIVLFNSVSSKKSLLTIIGKNSLWIYLGHTYFIAGFRIIIKYFL